MWATLDDGSLTIKGQLITCVCIYQPLVNDTSMWYNSTLNAWCLPYKVTKYDIPCKQRQPQMKSCSMDSSLFCGQLEAIVDYKQQIVYYPVLSLNKLKVTSWHTQTCNHFTRNFFPLVLSKTFVFYKNKHFVKCCVFQPDYGHKTLQLVKWHHNWKNLSTG